MDLARCQGVDTDTFFTPDDFSHPELTPRERDQLARDNRLRAQVICTGCPVRAACLDYANTNEIDHGTWGGRSPEQRKASGPPVSRYAYRGRLSPQEERIYGELRAGADLAAVAARFACSPERIRAVARKALATLAA